jgi:phage terminase small subunit
VTDQEKTVQQAFDDALAALLPKQRTFVQEYLACLNASEAARRAKYATKANVQGARMLANASIAAVVELGFQLHTMPPAEALARLSQQARGSMADFLRIDDEEITLTWSLLSVPEAKDGEADIAGTVMQLAAMENVKPTDRVLHTTTVKRSVARLDLMEAGRRGQLGLVKKYSLDDKGKVVIELYDAQAAQTLIGKHHKLFTEKIEHSGSINVSELSDDELRRLAEGTGPGRT